MKEWFELKDASDWINQVNKDGLVVDKRKSKRGHNMMRCSKTMPFTPMQIFLTLCEGSLRQAYDPNMDTTRNV